MSKGDEKGAAGDTGTHIDGIHSKKMDIESAIKIWERAVATQMHFNDMSARARQLGLTFVVATLGLVVVILGKEEPLVVKAAIGDYLYSTNVAGVLILISALGVLAVWRLDVGVYHHMLRGAVYFGEDIEKSYLSGDEIGYPEGMTALISRFSRFKDAERLQSGEYTGTKKRTASSKISWFYGIIFTTLIFLSLALVCIYGEKVPVPV